jgi:hypothetical protein
MELLGYGLAILIGLSLGLIGGGGSILTVPVLVYVMGVDPVLATAYSLFIVGLTALVGSVEYARRQELDYRTALIFGAPSIVAVYLTRKWLVPLIPDPVMQLGSLSLSKSLMIMLLFAVLMVAASVSMIRKQRPQEGRKQMRPGLKYALVFAEGAVVGTLTGFVGAGGGFLIIPALVLLAGLPMRRAVGTSLLIIAAKSLIGFLGDIGNQPISWQFLLIFSAFAIGGIFAGSALARRVRSEALKPVFGWFVLVMGVYIIVWELFFT